MSDQSYAERMAKKKAVVDAGIAAAPDERGLLLVHTGTGKGKSSAAFGLLARALGHGMKAAVIQFIKSRSDTGEEAFFRSHPGVDLACHGRRLHLGDPGRRPRCRRRPGRLGHGAGAISPTRPSASSSSTR